MLAIIPLALLALMIVDIRQKRRGEDAEHELEPEPWMFKHEAISEWVHLRLRYLLPSPRACPDEEVHVLGP